MACDVVQIIQDACTSGIGKEGDMISLLQIIAQLTCEIQDAPAPPSEGVPAGVILMWSGTVATIPTGWVLCDGTSGTPDLRNRFVVAAQQDDAGVAKTNLTGALTVSGGSITHTHGITDPSHNHVYGLFAAQEDLVTGTDVIADPLDGALTGITVNNASAPQPYYALAFIMKT